MNSQEVNELLDLRSLWQMVDPEHFHRKKTLLWEFPTAKTARLHLRAYECYMANWGWQHTKRVSIVGGEKSWSITPRRESVDLNFIPYPPHPYPSLEEGGSDQESGEEKFLVFAKTYLNSTLVDRLSDIKNSNQPLGIVDWTNQQQIVMNASSQQIPIGDSLEECLNWSRWQYWHPPDLQDFISRCRQELDQGGGNSIRADYLTFDPVNLRDGGDGDWMRVIANFTFLDCGRFGLYQLGENLQFDRVHPPN